MTQARDASTQLENNQTDQWSNFSPRSISTIIITQDEEVRTGKAICSCQAFSDEIIVVDGGSKDSTVQRAQELGCKVFINPWPGYAKQRRFGIDQAQHDWVFMIDSDEVVSEELAQSIAAWKHTQTLKADAFSVDRIGDFLGKWLTSRADYQIRLFNKTIFQVTDVLVHESIDSGENPVIQLEGVLWHYGFRSISDHVVRFNKYTDLEAQKDYLVGKRFSLARLLFKPPARFVQVYIVHQLYSKGLAGLSVALLKVYYDLLKEIKLYELGWTSGREH
ncbi:glycosyltransferase family 2 protein [Phormidesmis priestleyi]|uniref:glycosyltransferase family 2 protein n=1 Tax=Phormidesmis priestleyi TaxID=268141 RepID=UPI0009ED06C8|nr:glycosyltransferase family 2 protein [Phormidesmis priestleyi]